MVIEKDIFITYNILILSFLYVILSPFFLMYLSNKYVKTHSFELLIRIENLFMDLKTDKNRNIFYNCFLYIRKQLFTAILVFLHGYNELQLILITIINLLLILILIIIKPHLDKK